MVDLIVTAGCVSNFASSSISDISLMSNKIKSRMVVEFPEMVTKKLNNKLSTGSIM